MDTVAKTSLLRIPESHSDYITWLSGRVRSFSAGFGVFVGLTHVSSEASNSLKCTMAGPPGLEDPGPRGSEGPGNIKTRFLVKTIEWKHSSQTIICTGCHEG